MLSRLVLLDGGSGGVDVFVVIAWSVFSSLFILTLALVFLICSLDTILIVLSLVISLVPVFPNDRVFWVLIFLSFTLFTDALFLLCYSLVASAVLSSCLFVRGLSSPMVADRAILASLSRFRFLYLSCRSSSFIFTFVLSLYFLFAHGLNSDVLIELNVVIFLLPFDSLSFPFLCFCCLLGLSSSLLSVLPLSVLLNCMFCLL